MSIAKVLKLMFIAPLRLCQTVRGSSSPYIDASCPISNKPQRLSGRLHSQNFLKVGRAKFESTGCLGISGRWCSAAFMCLVLRRKGGVILGSSIANASGLRFCCHFLRIVRIGFQDRVVLVFDVSPLLFSLRLALTLALARSGNSHWAFVVAVLREVTVLQTFVTLMC